MRYSGPIPESVARLVLDLASPWIEADTVAVAKLRVGTFLSRVVMWIAQRWESGAGAATIGRHIFMRPEMWPLDRLPGIALLAHELVHVQQFRKFGPFRFAFRYLKDFFTKGYRNVEFEKEAYEIQELVRERWIADNPNQVSLREYY